MSRLLPTAAEVRDAHARIAPFVRRTRLVRSDALSSALGTDAHLKLECEQDGGSFKLRGALNALLVLPDATRARGVVASSAGNHGIGIAMAARQVGVTATIFVPASAPAVKRDRIAAFGATVDATQPHYDAAEDAAKAFAARTGATFVGPCTGRALLAGAGTVALEILGDLPSVRSLVVCVGGGGLVGGIAGFVHDVAAHVRILGAQGERTNAMALALERGAAVDIPDLPTLADGLAGRVDEEMYEQGRQAIDHIATVAEREIAEAIRWLHAAHGLVVEGSGAVGVAALRSGRLGPIAGPVAVTVSGGNIDGERHRGVLRGTKSEEKDRGARGEG